MRWARKDNKVCVISIVFTYLVRVLDRERNIDMGGPASCLYHKNNFINKRNYNVTSIEIY